MIARLLIVPLLSILISGENTAIISGSVVDSKENPINDAEIILLPRSYPTTHTNDKGIFSFDAIEPGEYTIVILANGFESWARRGISVESGETATIDVTLTASNEKKFFVKYIKPRQKDIDAYLPILKTFNEPGFCDQKLLDATHESYRFLWMRTFDHPVLISLENRGPGEAHINYKELDGMGGYDWGSLIEEKSVDVYKKLGKGEQPDHIVQGGVDHLFESAQTKVWEQPYAIAETVGVDGSITIILDGASWTIEAIKDGKCHLVTRHSPELSDPVRQFAGTLINLSGKRFYYDEVY